MQTSTSKNTKLLSHYCNTSLARRRCHQFLLRKLCASFDPLIAPFGELFLQPCELRGLRIRSANGLGNVCMVGAVKQANGRLRVTKAPWRWTIINKKKQESLKLSKCQEEARKEERSSFFIRPFSFYFWSLIQLSHHPLTNITQPLAGGFYFMMGRLDLGFDVLQIDAFIFGPLKAI